MINPEKRAEILRKKLIKGNKYLISQIFGQSQEAGERKVLDVYFRYKDYLNPLEIPDYFSASLQEVWSPKFLGLREDFLNLPIRKVKKLEHQNPSYSAAFRFSGRKGDPRKYAKVFTIQVAGCNFDCIYCYVPEHLKSANPEFGKYFSVKEIVDQFLKIKEQNEDEDWNVLRISGGEPLTIVPEIILDIQREVEKRCPDVYLWIDTNLSNLNYLKKFKKELKEVLQKRNVGVVGCFKGVNKSDFSILTGAAEKFYETQFEAAKLLVGWGTDVYFYLPALVYENNVKIKVENFVERLQKIHKNLPLRLEVISIIDYPAAEETTEKRAKAGRLMPGLDQRVVFDLWYRKILPKFYSKEELEKYCCEVKLG
jgi:uncharacterized Fe-S cluster-containing radical SAM superfamily protein